MKALSRHDGDVAYAIPSPERRTEKNWVLDTAPCCPELPEFKKGIGLLRSRLFRELGSSLVRCRLSLS